jgi:hypothetical protein
MLFNTSDKPELDRCLFLLFLIVDLFNFKSADKSLNTAQV